MILLPRTRLVLAAVFGLYAIAVLALAPATTAVSLAGETFHLELATDPAARNQGLMYREEIAADGGMLFVFPKPTARNFWMANCLVDMDILFLDADGVVTTRHEMFAEPPRGEDEAIADYYRRLPRYPSEGEVQFAIELRHGTADRLGIAVGDRIDLDISGLVALAR